MDRRHTVFWMREVLDHLNRCCDQWQSADESSERFVVDAIERDLSELRRICHLTSADPPRNMLRRTSAA